MSLAIEYYEHLGFKSNPFSVVNAEDETAYLEKIFLDPPYFYSILDDLRNGRPKYIIGERGTGKTALIFKLRSSLSNLDCNDVFSILIDDYDDLPLTNNSKEFLVKIISKLTIHFSVFLLKNKSLVSHLSKYDKEKLFFIVKTFFKSLSKAEYENIEDKLMHIKLKNNTKKIFNNFLLKPLNIFFSGVNLMITEKIEAISVAKALKIDTLNIPQEYTEYFKGFNIETAFTSANSIPNFSYSQLKQMFSDLTEIIHKCGFRNTVIFFDRIDEIPGLNGMTSKISTFIESALNDPQLIQTNYVSFVFVLWIRLKKILDNKNIRFDKFPPQNVIWKNTDIIKIFNRRLEFFSTGEKITIDTLIHDEPTIKKLIKLCNKSPRELLTLFDKIYNEQYYLDNTSTYFTNESIENGIRSFIKDYSFGTRYQINNSTIYSDIYLIIDLLLKMKKEFFTTNDLIENSSLDLLKSSEIINILKNCELVEEYIESNITTYKISDYKIVYLIENGYVSFKKLEEYENEL